MFRTRSGLAPPPVNSDEAKDEELLARMASGAARAVKIGEVLLLGFKLFRPASTARQASLRAA